MERILSYLSLPVTQDSSLLYIPDFCTRTTRSLLEEIRARYPTASTWHELATFAVASRDIRTLQTLHDTCSFLPIRWEALIPAMDLVLTTMLDIPVLNTTVGEDDDTLLLRTNTYNLGIMMRQSIDESRLALIDALLLQYAPNDPRGYLFRNGYLDELLPVSVMSMFFDRGYYTDPTIAGIHRRVIEAIVKDDPRLLPQNHILTTEERALMYDADAYSLYSSVTFSGSISPFRIHGRILSSMMSTPQSSYDLRFLLSEATASDVILQLSVNDSLPVQLLLLQYCVEQGYIEVLDRFLSPSLFLLVLTSVRTNNPYYDALISLFNYHVSGIGTALNDVYSGSNVSLSEQFALGAIINDNEELLRSISLRTPRMFEVLSLYHRDDPEVYSRLYAILT